MAESQREVRLNNIVNAMSDNQINEYDFLSTFYHEHKDKYNVLLSHSHDYEDLLSFFKSAFIPDVSIKQNPDRFDITHLIEEIPQRGPENPIQILDVCCGTCLALESLMTKHPVGNCNGFSRFIKYVGVDLYFNPLWDKHRGVITKLQNNECQCFADPLFVDDIDITKTQNFLNELNTKIDSHNRNKITKYNLAKNFDKIFLTNTLHEIAPIKQVELLLTLASLLKVGGKLIIIDTDVSWCHANKPILGEKERHPEHWNLENRDLLKSEWEACATRYRGYDETMRAIFESLGLQDPTCNPYPNRNGTWICKGEKKADILPNAEQLKNAIFEANINHDDADEETVIKLREELVETFKENKEKPVIENKNLIPRIMKYFCLSSSILYRAERRKEMLNAN